MNRAELLAAALAPRPIQVGDRVTWDKGRWVEYEVLAIRGEEACFVNVRAFYTVLREGMCVAPVSSLTKVFP